MTNEQAIVDFQTAREHYIARRFAEARAAMHRYRQAIDYAQFEQIDRRPKTQPEITVVIVSYQTNHALLDCLKSVFEQQGPAFEIILVDNGGNQSIHSELAKQQLLWIKPPINLLPSEGRNIGAHFARSELLVFLDDDALMAPGYLAVACKTMADESILALRGRILPKTAKSAARQPQHYDLGDKPQPAELNLEGNSVIRRKAYLALNGFDPLLFGHEGKELTQRCRSAFPNQQILYWPLLVIWHDYAHAERLAGKRERQSLAKDYLNYLKEHTMNAGVSILVRADDNLAAANDFLASLVEHNSCKPIEVLLWAKDSQQALATSRAYLAKLFVRVLPASTHTLGRIAQQARYNNLLIVDLPTQITSDVLPGWLQHQKTNLNTALLCGKQQLSTLSDTALTIELTQLANKLGKDTFQNAPKAAEQTNKPAGKPTLQAQQAGQPRNISILTSNNPRNIKNIKVSVIIPVFNKAETLQKSFDSVLATGRDDIECIFIDDLSSDGSRSLIDAIRQSHKNIVSIFNQENIGAGASRNIGLNNAVGEYIFFLDADDQIDGGALSELIEVADKHSADLVRGKIRGIKSDGTPQLLAKEHLLHNNLKIGASWQKDSSLWFYWYFTANLYRRSFLDRNYIRFPEGVRNEDPLFLCKCYLYAKNIVLYPSTTYIYSITEAQQNRSGSDFLKGWVLGYYSVYQLICTQKIQKAYFLCLFPSFEKHCKNIVKCFDEEEAIRLFNFISVMYRTFDDDIKTYENYLEGIKTNKKPWQLKDLDNTISFARAISGSSSASIYNLLK